MTVHNSATMQTIAMISQKGGSGKTTLAIHLAVEARTDNRKVAIIDLDPQASAASWGDRRRDGTPPIVISAHAKRLRQEMQRAQNAGADLLVIDTAPHADSAALIAAGVADLTIVPCRPSVFDIETAQTTLELVATTGTPAMVVMNAVPPWGGDTDQAEEALRKAGISLCPTRLIQRVAFGRALLTGQAAQEIEPAGKASGEIRTLTHFLLAQLKKGDGT